jgi:hypothetical protein
MSFLFPRSSFCLGLSEQIHSLFPEELARSSLEGNLVKDLGLGFWDSVLWVNAEKKNSSWPIPRMGTYL